MKIDLTSKISSLYFKNPIFVSSGTFGYGYESKDLIPYSKLGGIITKSITLKPRIGNPPPRLCEIPSGIINSIGLQNVGIEKFLSDILPILKTLKIPIIVSIAGETIEEYYKIAQILKSFNDISAIEINLSCPNVKNVIFAKNKYFVKRIVSGIKRITDHPLIAKLSPQVTSISEIAIVAQHAGADALNIANTFPGMAIDIKTWKPKLGNIYGGVSGPAIKPLILWCVWEAKKYVSIPIIASGGIVCGEDAIEFLLAGAEFISVGTGNFINPMIPVEISEYIERYLQSNGCNKIKDIIGKMIS